MLNTYQDSSTVFIKFIKSDMLSTFLVSAESSVYKEVLLVGADNTVRVRGTIRTLEKTLSNSWESFMMNVTGMILHTFSWKISSFLGRKRTKDQYNLKNKTNKIESFYEVSSFC